MNDDWIEFYLGMAEYVSTKSKDPSTKCGCVIARPNKSLCSIGFNGFPAAIEDKQEWLNDREMKYKLIVHAEDHAFKNAVDPSFIGYSLFVHPFMPCPQCALDIVSNGISTVYARPTPEDKKSRWDERFRDTQMIFDMADVKLEIVDYKE